MLIIIRKISIIFFLIFALSFSSYAVSAPQTSASSAVLIDSDTLEIIYEKDAFSKRSMASTTKIMTALIAVESGKMKDIVTVKEKIYIEGTAIGFEVGDKLTLETICYAMLLESGNDAAVLTAKYLSGSEEKFSELMNKTAHKIGMKNTNFVTASGLDDENHYTTAYDLALLGAYAIKNTVFREICSTKNYKAEFQSYDKVRYFSNHNRLLSSCKGVIGIKTGFTKKSGRCLVSACERNGKILVAVTLNASDDWNDHRKLYDYGYSLYREYNPGIVFPEKLTVHGSDDNTVNLTAPANPSVYILENSKTDVKVYINKNIYAPIKKNDVMGKIEILQNGCIIKEIPVISADTVNLTANYKTFELTVKDRVIMFFRKLFTCSDKER